ncbi:hypothetical protein DFH28DRAFT_978243 [Melampsora americana]|nr:hypothetical protein DFH28DRAFT_978243 [Melampsora americana]
MTESSSKVQEAVPKVFKATIIQGTHVQAVKHIRQALLEFTPISKGKEVLSIVREVNKTFNNENATVFKGQMEDFKTAEVARVGT